MFDILFTKIVRATAGNVAIKVCDRTYNTTFLFSLVFLGVISIRVLFSHSAVFYWSGEIEFVFFQATHYTCQPSVK